MLYCTGYWGFYQAACQGFFEKVCIKSLSNVLKTTYEWPKIYAVCGGRPHLLRACAGNAEEHACWMKVRNSDPDVLLLTLISIAVLIKWVGPASAYLKNSAFHTSSVYVCSSNHTCE